MSYAITKIFALRSAILLEAKLDQFLKSEVVLVLLKLIISIFGSFLLVYLFAILFLAAKYYLPTRLSRVFGQNKETNPNIISVILHNIDTSLRRFIAVKTLISLLIGTLTAITAFFFGVSYPLFWGLITFFLNYIPTVGSFLPQ